MKIRRPLGYRGCALQVTFNEVHYYYDYFLNKFVLTHRTNLVNTFGAPPKQGIWLVWQVARRHWFTPGSEPSLAYFCMGLPQAIRFRDEARPPWIDQQVWLKNDEGVKHGLCYTESNRCSIHCRHLNQISRPTSISLKIPHKYHDISFYNLHSVFDYQILEQNEALSTPYSSLQYVNSGAKWTALSTIRFIPFT